MKANFKRVTAFAFAFAISVSSFACNQGNKRVQNNNEALISSLMEDFDGGYSNGIFSDSSESFAEMEKVHSVQIVRGVVKSAEPASEEALAQKAVVEVHCVYKGMALNTVNVFQLYDNPVEIGKEYLLFLAKQYPDDPDSVDFYTVGGDQGSLCIDRQSRRIVVNSSQIADEDLKQWLRGNISDNKDESARIADYEIILSSEVNCD